MAKVPTPAETPDPQVRRRAPEGETARDRFKRVAGNRLSNALDAIRLLGSMGPSAEYEYGPEDVQAIVGAISKVTKDAAELLTTRKAKKSVAADIFS